MTVTYNSSQKATLNSIANMIETNYSQIARWLQIYFGPTWVGYVDRSADSVLVWFMRAIVGHYNPTLTGVPFNKLIGE